MQWCNQPKVTQYHKEATALARGLFVLTIAFIIHWERFAKIQFSIPGHNLHDYISYITVSLSHTNTLGIPLFSLSYFPPTLVAFSERSSATQVKYLIFVSMSASVPVPFPFCQDLCPAVTANVCNPSLIDPTEKVSSLMPDLSLRAIRAMGATEQHFGL